jgi:2-oxoglutarate ferredoxin oxidoreductase subunit delta
MMSDEENNQEIKITINRDWCKGCSICADLCPQDVLTMEKGVATVYNLDACTACQLCELRCPDFAITVVGKPKKKKNAA